MGSNAIVKTCRVELVKANSYTSDRNLLFQLDCGQRNAAYSEVTNMAMSFIVNCLEWIWTWQLVGDWQEQMSLSKKQ